MTIADRVARYLTNEFGMVERNPKRRHRWFTGDRGRNYFVGRNGAVRSGTTLSGSVSLTPIIHARMSYWEAKNGL